MALANGLEVLSVVASDRFGDYGLVGLIAYRLRDKSFDVEAFLLSCRALGRGVEHRMLAAASETALANGINQVTFHVVESERNQPAREFLFSAARRMNATEHDGIYHFDAASAVSYRFQPEDPSGPLLQGDRPTHSERALSAIDASVLADRTTRYTSAGLLVTHLLHERQAKSCTVGVLATDWVDPAGPRTWIEDEIAAAWSEVLGIEQVGLGDDFFVAGGTSIQAAELVAKISMRLGIPASAIDIFSDAITVEILARTVEQHRLEEMDDAELETSLGDIAAGLNTGQAQNISMTK